MHATVSKTGESAEKAAPAEQQATTVASAALDQTPLWAQGFPVQFNLKVNRPRDRYEQEADHVAQQVMQMPAPRLQRKTCACGRPAGPDGICAECQRKRRRLQRKATGVGEQTVAPSAVHAVLRTPGRPLDPRTRTFMESRFGHDFRHVRVHTDAQAAASAEAVEARAYTVGHTITFGKGQYRPETAAGRQLLAHELTHVMQQERKPLRLQRAVTRGAGGCGPPTEIDEDDTGAKRAGSAAHTQIQTFLLSSGILAELEIPRATKRQIGDTGCQSSGVHPGFADLWKPGGVVGIAEIKPIGFAGRYAIPEAEHYIRRARQSLDRVVGTGRCGGETAGADDTTFATMVGMLGPVASRVRFTKLRSILPGTTVIGPFDGDRSRTLKAKLHAPGAVGYWCTGGASETLPCDASSEQIDAYIDRILSTAQHTVDQFLENKIIQPLDDALSDMDIERLLTLANEHLGPVVRRLVAESLGVPESLIPDLSPATITQIADLINAQLDSVARSIVRLILRRIKNLVLGELRRQLRRGLRNMLRRAIAAICVGVPVVTLAHLLDELERMLENEIRQLMPAVLAAVAIQIADAIAAELAEAILAALEAIGSFLEKVFAVIGIVLLAAAVVILAFLALVAIFDPAPGDEAALAAAAAFLARLIPQLARTAFAGATL